MKRGTACPKVRLTKSGRQALAAVLLMLCVGLSMAPAAHGQTSTQARAQISQAYAAVLAAEQGGGNVTSLVAKLDSAISLVQQADRLNGTSPARAQSLYSQASALTQQVIGGAPGVGTAGKAAVAASQLDLAVETVVLAALAALAYFYAPRAFWGGWLWAHRGWRVRKR